MDEQVANVRRWPLILILLMLVTIGGVGATLLEPAAAAERPNIVWMIADDLSPDLGCYGYEGVNTPNIDRLAGRGTSYTHAFATAPVCSSSRSAFITGVYQTTTGTHQHRTANKQPLPEPIEPITELMRRAGYFVCNGNSAMKRPGKGDYNFRFSGKMYDGADWSKRAEGQPFFAQVQIHEPHRDFDKARPDRRQANFDMPSYYPDHPVVRADWANYLATIEGLDRKVGAVLERLEREGLTGDTVVFFFGDHGRPHYRDKQWLYDGGIRVPLIVSGAESWQAGTVRDELVSLIDVSAATLGLAGIEPPSWMHGRDMLADEFTGREVIFASRDRCGDAVDRIRCVRTSRFKYIRNFYPERPYSQHSNYKTLQYPGITVARVLQQNGKLTGAPAVFWKDRRPAEELYDMQSDPEELRNLAHDPTHAKLLARLRGDLDRWMARTNDQGGIAESQLQATVDSSDRWYQTRMKKRGLPSDVAPGEYLRWWEKELGVE